MSHSISWRFLRWLQFAVASLFLVMGCVTVPPETQPQAFERWVEKQEKVSWDYLQQNISPTEPKEIGGPKPRKGIVVAALHKKDPDYYFHWVRDSANVMRVVVQRWETRQLETAKLDAMMNDFISLSRDLQDTKSVHGLGDPRFTVTGDVDPLAWSRPQYDGPALRALALLRYLEFLDRQKSKQDRDVVLKVLRRDLDFVNSVWNHQGFDVWEERKAENYHTRLVQAEALKQGAARFKSAPYLRTALKLEKQLDEHWNPEKGFLRAQLKISATDGYTKKQTDLDSAVILAVVESGRMYGKHSVMDDRVQATVQVLEDLFRRRFPINQEAKQGLAYGRYEGDHYYGGNPWYLVTAGYAQFYDLLSMSLLNGASFVVTSKNWAFTKALLPDDLPPLEGKDFQIRSGTDLHRRLIRASAEKADAILARIQEYTPADGQLYEQFDQKTGAPVSSRGIGWSHSALIAAFLDRAAVQQKLSF